MSDPILTPATMAQQATGQAVPTQARFNRASLYSAANGSAAQFSGTLVRSVAPQVISQQAQVERKASAGINGLLPTNGVSTAPDLTLKEAIEYLFRDEEKFQLSGASFIQQSTFKEDKSKQEVWQMGGIPPMVSLLHSPNPQVQQTAAAALRNLVFKDIDNKLEVLNCGGLDAVLTLLKSTSSSLTQKQLTGLLWNLSSADQLKPELVKNVLPVLTESVVVPYTCWSDSTASNNIDPEVFHNATACLRNLSGASKEERQAMRECRGLIESIVTYVNSSVGGDNPDNTSVENCVCILHNLTYQLESEAPDHFAKFTTPPQSRSNGSGDKKPLNVGCFSPKSKRGLVNTVNNSKNTFSLPLTEETNPKGLSWLYHSSTLRAYLTMLDSSRKEGTLEACCGALQNLTASKSQFSNLMSETIVKKLNGLQSISSMLHCSSPGQQKIVMALLSNLSRAKAVQGSMGKNKNSHAQTLWSLCVNYCTTELCVFLSQGHPPSTGHNC
uniref:Plakophilin 1b n=1 Tax=Denticeps clupeoides TaxID=299321 RepID=A0AAY4CNK7_9TELE